MGAMDITYAGFHTCLALQLIENPKYFMKYNVFIFKYTYQYTGYTLWLF